MVKLINRLSWHRKNLYWLPEIIAKIRELACQGMVGFTIKAFEELKAIDLGLNAMDVCNILEELNESDFAEVITSVITGEKLYVFIPNVAGIEIYMKLVIRQNCVVISFHEDQKNEN